METSGKSFLQNEVGYRDMAQSTKKETTTAITQLRHTNQHDTIPTSLFYDQKRCRDGVMLICVSYLCNDPLFFPIWWF